MIVYLISYAGDETFNVQLGRTRFLTRSISTLQTPGCLFQSTPFGQCGMFDVAKIILQRVTTLKFDILQL